MKKKILFCFLVATTLTYVQSYEFNIYRKIDVKSTNLYPKIETFHPPKGYQPVKGYEPVNYRPNILNYFLNQKRKFPLSKNGNKSALFLQYIQ
jgi:hypothetical protein